MQPGIFKCHHHVQCSIEDSTQGNITPKLLTVIYVPNRFRFMKLFIGIWMMFRFQWQTETFWQELGLNPKLFQYHHFD